MIFHWKANAVILVNVFFLSIRKAKAVFWQTFISVNKKKSKKK